MSVSNSKASMTITKRGNHTYIYFKVITTSSDVLKSCSEYGFL